MYVSRGLGFAGTMAASKVLHIATAVQCIVRLFVRFIYCGSSDFWVMSHRLSLLLKFYRLCTDVCFVKLV